MKLGAVCFGPRACYSAVSVAIKLFQIVVYLLVELVYKSCLDNLWLLRGRCGTNRLARAAIYQLLLVLNRCCLVV